MTYLLAVSVALFFTSTCVLRSRWFGARTRRVASDLLIVSGICAHLMVIHCLFGGFLKVALVFLVVGLFLMERILLQPAPRQ